MKMYFKSLIFALTGALMITACSNEIEEQLAENGKNGQNVKFSIGVENLSRTAIADGTLVTSFEQNDEIGIFAYDGEKLVSSNVKYTYNGSKWTSENAIAAQDGVKLSYYAYYPYSESVTDPSAINVTVNSDQATNGFSKDDVLTAQNTTAEAGAENVTLTFNHAFAMVQVGIKSGLTTDTEATVTLESILPTAVVNAKAGTVGTASGEKTSIQMQKTNADKWEYRAIVPAQGIASGSKLLTIVAGGKTYAVTYSSTEGQAVSYVAGKALQITVNSLVALPEGNEVTIGGSITDWDASTSDPGEGDVTEVPTESLDLSALEGFDAMVLKSGWGTDKVTGEENLWFKRETIENLVTYEKIGGNEIKMLLMQGEKKAAWNNNSIGFHSGLMFDNTKNYILTFDAKSEEASGTISVGISNSTDTELFLLDSGATIASKTVSSTYQSFTVTFDFTQAATNIASSAPSVTTATSTTSADTNSGINIVFYNNTNNKDASSILYVKNIKLNVVK